MIDELDLAFDEPIERWRHRRRRGGKQKRTRGRGRSVAAFLVVLILLGGLAGGAWWGFGRIEGLFKAPDYPGGGTGAVTIEIKSGDTLTDVGNTLLTAGVVKSVKAFTQAAGKNSKSSSIQPGFYKLRRQMRATEALGLLLDLKNKVVSRVTIPEGMITTDVYARLAKATKLPVADFLAAAKNPAALGLDPAWLKRDDGKQVAASLEGFLFPATYDFGPGVTAQQVLTDIIAKFNDEMEQLNFVATVRANPNLHIAPYEALIAASIAQVEGVIPADLPGITQVLYNRVYKSANGDIGCPCLALDSTVNYYLQITGRKAKASEQLTQSELHDPKDPYNTRDKAGWPLGPISNPGEAALTAAMKPTKNNFYYFIAVDKAGHTAFARNIGEHNRNIQKACKNGIPLC